jgi:hypothetical protein
MAEFVVTVEFKDGEDDLAFRVTAANAEAAVDLVWAWAEDNVTGRVDAAHADPLEDAIGDWGIGVLDLERVN